jgi:hypothetical protein
LCSALIARERYAREERESNNRSLESDYILHDFGLLLFFGSKFLYLSLLSLSALLCSFRYLLFMDRSVSASASVCVLFALLAYCARLLTDNVKCQINEMQWGEMAVG